MLGGSTSLLGATGTVSLLARVTKWAAVVFGITCITLSIFLKPHAGSVLDKIGVPPATPPSATDTSKAPAPDAAKPIEAGTTNPVQGTAPVAPAPAK